MNPVKIFADLLGQFGGLMRLFDKYGYIDYLFLGEYVDLGQLSLEMISVLHALKLLLGVEYPQDVHMIRENPEAADIDALFGFTIECTERIDERDDIWAWHKIKRLFNWLPLAARIENKIICIAWWHLSLYKSPGINMISSSYGFIMEVACEPRTQHIDALLDIICESFLVELYMYLHNFEVACLKLA
ncbi:serine/threonine-protein phosphatase BSL2 homolog [Papaver somniferum]|uniref:serine/threonine-protein phosphatase BSL2 homolog n=1 Tax=Papaver somniferum TaxID=3469 RepID=UPI000E701DDB|nr:serine/threonine-protein phosphatase BSL2 homolog [Papaver somniferum]